MLEFIKNVSAQLSPVMIYTICLLCIIYYLGEKSFRCIMFRIDKNIIRNEKLQEKNISILNSMLEQIKKSDIDRSKILFQLDFIIKKLSNHIKN